MGVYAGPEINESGLVLCLDAGNNKSYPGSGTTWTDLSGRGNNGTLINGPTFNSNNGGSIVFDGTNDYVDCGLASSLILANNQFHVSYFLYMTGTARGDFFSIKNFNASSDDIGVFIDTDNKVSVYFKVQNVISNTAPGPGFSRASISTAVIERNKYVNIQVQKDADQKIGIFINGQLDNKTYSTTTNTANVASTSLWIGSNKTSNTAAALSFPGRIGNVQIYNRALSAAEIKQNFNATRGRYGI